MYGTLLGLPWGKWEAKACVQMQRTWEADLQGAWMGCPLSSGAHDSSAWPLMGFVHGAAEGLLRPPPLASLCPSAPGNPFTASAARSSFRCPCSRGPVYSSRIFYLVEVLALGEGGQSLS